MYTMPSPPYYHPPWHVPAWKRQKVPVIPAWGITPLGITLGWVCPVNQILPIALLSPPLRYQPPCGIIPLYCLGGCAKCPYHRGDFLRQRRYRNGKANSNTSIGILQWTTTAKLPPSTNPWRSSIACGPRANFQQQHTYGARSRMNAHDVDKQADYVVSYRVVLWINNQRDD